MARKIVAYISLLNILHRKKQLFFSTPLVPCRREGKYLTAFSTSLKILDGVLYTFKKKLAVGILDMPQINICIRVIEYQVWILEMRRLIVFV